MEVKTSVKKFILENRHLFPNTFGLDNLAEYLDVIASSHIDNFSDDDLLCALRELARIQHSMDTDSIVLLTVINKCALDIYKKLRRQHTRVPALTCASRFFACFLQHRRYERHR